MADILVNDNVQSAALIALAAQLTASFGGHCTHVNARVLECTQTFAANGGAESFAVFLPAKPPSKAILFLHGAGRDHLTLARTPELLDGATSAIVFPKGKLSWWVDSPGSRYESFALELMDRMALALKLPADAAHWSVAGWSMGGFGSLRLATRYPKRFGAWGGIVALADFPNPAYPKESNHSVPAFLTADANPLPRVDALRGKRVWFLTGETAFDRAMNQTLHQRLDQLGIAHEFVVRPGAHEFRVVAAALPAMLAFLEQRP